METQTKPDTVSDKILQRLDAMAAQMTAMAIDIAVIKATNATKDDLIKTTEAIGKNREDIAKMEATLLKWFFGTAIGLASLAFVAAKFVR